MCLKFKILIALISLAPLASLAEVPKANGPSSCSETSKFKAGGYAVIQNSTDSWNDSVVKVADVFEDCSLRVRFPDGTKAFIRKENLEINLSPEVPFLMSNNTKINTGDRVYYPAQATSLMIPEAPVEHLFANGKVEIVAGLHHVYDIQNVGKEVKCSPQKPSVCEDDYAIANGYKENRPFTFEGTLSKIYSNGTVIVHSSYFWNYPVDISGVIKRVASDNYELSGSVISSNNVAKTLSGGVTPEVDTGAYDPFHEQISPNVKVQPAF